MKRSTVWFLCLIMGAGVLPHSTVITAAPLAAAGGKVVSTQALTPDLYINKTWFDGPFDPSWAISVYNADPDSDVVLEEYRWNGVGWDQTWNGVVTTTNNVGFAYWNHFGPDRGGYYYAQVRVNGALSNPVSYTVGRS
jgi:hypothetical protein